MSSTTVTYRTTAADVAVNGTGLRDSSVTLAAAVALCAWMAGQSTLAGQPSLVGGTAALTGVAVVAAAAFTVISRERRWSGPADRVTLARTVLIGGCATMAVMIVAGTLAARPWWLLALAVPALALDGVDGFVARRTGTSSAAGARLDMEMDAALLLVLSVVAVGSLGWWVLAVGGMRYAFVLAARFRPALRGTLEFSQFRRVVAALQGVALVVGLAPAVPLAAGRAVVAVALTLLVVSFARDIRTLETSR